MIGTTENWSCILFGTNRANEKVRKSYANPEFLNTESLATNFAEARQVKELLLKMVSFKFSSHSMPLSGRGEGVRVQNLLQSEFLQHFQGVFSFVF